jgi:hypothetical protein
MPPATVNAPTPPALASISDFIIVGGASTTRTAAAGTPVTSVTGNLFLRLFGGGRQLQFGPLSDTIGNAGGDAVRTAMSSSTIFNLALPAPPADPAPAAIISNGAASTATATNGDGKSETLGSDGDTAVELKSETTFAMGFGKSINIKAPTAEEKKLAFAKANGSFAQMIRPQETPKGISFSSQFGTSGGPPPVTGQTITGDNFARLFGGN